MYINFIANPHFEPSFYQLQYPQINQSPSLNVGKSVNAEASGRGQDDYFSIQPLQSMWHHHRLNLKMEVIQEQRW